MLDSPGGMNHGRRGGTAGIAEWIARRDRDVKFSLLLEQQGRKGGVGDGAGTGACPKM
jgi:hypothetical protein